MIREALLAAPATLGGDEFFNEEKRRLRVIQELREKVDSVKVKHRQSQAAKKARRRHKVMQARLQEAQQAE